MKEKINDISKIISSLSGRIKDIEEELNAESVAFLSVRTMKDYTLIVRELGEC